MKMLRGLTQILFLSQRSSSKLHKHINNLCYLFFPGTFCKFMIGSCEREELFQWNGFNKRLESGCMNVFETVLLLFNINLACLTPILFVSIIKMLFVSLNKQELPINFQLRTSAEFPPHCLIIYCTLLFLFIPQIWVYSNRSSISEMKVF